jgi:Lanthionine synthetase C-like protein/Protein kinase domain
LIESSHDLNQEEPKVPIADPVRRLESSKVPIATPNELRAYNDYCSFAGIILQAIQQLNSDQGEWFVDAKPSGRWLVVSHRGAVVPEQGWKLHISANILNGAEVLSRVLTVLLNEPVVFKVAGSVQALAALNDGTAGLSQIGKFITIYPVDDAQGVHLAIRLAAATKDLIGPSILSDRPLLRGGVIYYRFGSFGGLTMQSPAGEISFALRTPQGNFEPDKRDNAYRQPSWITDPFMAAGIADPPQTRSQLIANRFLIVGLLHQSARGHVYLAIDLDKPGKCVLKHAEPGALISPEGREARDYLRHEAAVLKRLGPDARVPSVFALVEDNNSLYLAMEDLEGDTLERHVQSHNPRGRTLGHSRIVAWGRELLAILVSIHSAGLVYGDLKSSNIIITPNGRLRIIDFEHAYEQATARPPGRGTRGYMSPQQAAGHPAHFTDDVYGFGALLFYMTTGAEPSHAPRPNSLLDRSLEILQPGIDPRLAGVISRCLASDAAARFPNIGAVDAALAAIDSGTVITRPMPRLTSPENEAAARKRCRDLSRRLGDTICRAAQPIAEGINSTWISKHPLALGKNARDVHVGVAGTLLALAELVHEFGITAHRAVLQQAALALVQAPMIRGDPLPGLYVGEAGVAAALLLAGQVLGDRDLIDAARRHGRRVDELPHTSPDLFNGSAGRLRFHLIMWDSTHDRKDLAAAVTAGEHLLATMASTADGGHYWTIPSGYGAMTGQSYLGYAHGAAGIADVLLDLFEVTADGRFLTAARGAAQWLLSLGVPALNDGGGLCWPATEGADPVPAYWCHGAGGIGRFWLHAASHDLVPGAASIADRAIGSAAHGVRWAGSTQCHGLTGAIEVVLDAYQATGNTDRLAEARTLEKLLLTFARETNDGLVWPSEYPNVITPDFNLGYAGVASTLLRLSDPERRPHCLSRGAFRIDKRPNFQ